MSYPIWRLRDIEPIETYNPDPRILLIGDAGGLLACHRIETSELTTSFVSAHACWPYLGRGAVTAFIDGAVLGNSITKAGFDVPKAFKDFNVERRPEGVRLWKSAREECDNWWAIGAGSRTHKLVLANMDGRRIAKEKI